jgi:hypothetical protein
VSHALGPDTDHGDGLDVISALLTVFGGLADPRRAPGLREEPRSQGDRGSRRSEPAPPTGG